MNLKASPRSSAWVAVAALAASALVVALVPLTLPDDYSWLEHTTSESGAQGVEGAWLGRLGLLLFGLGVIGVVFVARTVWGPLASVLHLAVGVLLVASAYFATRSWREGAPYDRTEDVLHSIAATAMGFAFAVGVVAALVVARPPERIRWVIGAIGVAASIVLPIGMAVGPDRQGLLQRAMFVVVYCWYGTEALAASGREPHHR